MPIKLLHTKSKEDMLWCIETPPPFLTNEETFTIKLEAPNPNQDPIGYLHGTGISI